MSAEQNSPDAPFVQTLIIEYYSEKEPPQLVQQLITNYYSYSTNSVDIESSETEVSTARRSLPTVSESHISSTPISKVGNIAWYMNCSRTEGDSRKQLAKGPDSLFATHTVEESTQSVGYSSNSNSISILLQKYFIQCSCIFLITTGGFVSYFF